MADETHTIKAVLDTSELQSQLNEARDTISRSLSDAFTSAVPDLSELLSGGAAGGMQVGRSAQNLTGGVIQSLGSATAGVASGLSGGGSRGFGQADHAPGYSDAMLGPGGMQQQALFGRIGLDDSLVDARGAAQRRFVASAVGKKDTFANAPGLVAGGVVGAATLGTGWMAAAGLGLGTEMGIGAPFGMVADAMFDEEAWRDHFAAKDTVERSFDFGPMGALGSASGLTSPQFSNALASRINRINKKSHTSELGDLLEVTNIFGSSGYLDQAAMSGKDITQSADNVASQIEKLSTRVARVRGQLDVDSGTAASLLMGGIQSGMSEQESERLLLRGGATASMAGMSTSDSMAATSGVAGAFHNAGINTGFAREATESGAFTARALQQTGAIGGADWQRLGGTVGVTQMLAMSGASVLASEGGLPLVAAASSNPGLIKQFMNREIDMAQLKQEAGNIYGKMDETEKDSLRAKFQSGDIELPAGMLESTQAVELLGEYKKARPDAPVTQENLQNFFSATGRVGTPEQAKLMASMVHTVANDPMSLMGKGAEMERFVDRKEDSAKAETQNQQYEQERRQNMIVNRVTRGTKKVFTDAGEMLFGKPSDVAELEVDRASIRQEYEDTLASTQGMGRKQALDVVDAAQLRYASRMREHVNMKEEGGGFIDASQMKMGQMWDHGVTKALDAIPFEWARSWKQNRLMAVGSDDEDQQDAPGGGGEGAPIDMQLLNQAAQSGQQDTYLLMQIVGQLEAMNSKL